MSLTLPKAIIFDWDNTLVSSWDKLHYSMNDTLSMLGMEKWSIADVQSRMHHSSRDFFPKVFGDAAQKAKDHFYETYRSNFAEVVHPLDGAEETLEALKELDIKSAILSNKTGDILRREVNIAEWTPYFKSILGAYDCPEDKPSPIPVFRTLEKLELEVGEHVWFIGDTIVDMECAKNSQCMPIFFGETIEDAPHPDDFGINHHHVIDHKKLTNLIKSLKV